MSLPSSAPEAAPTPVDPRPMSGPLAASLQMRIIYRDSTRTVHLDWPFERLAEAIGDKAGTVWVDIQAANGELAAIETLFDEQFHFHPLAIEDALCESNSPKLDDWGDYLYTVFHAVRFEAGSLEVQLEELDIFLGRNYLITHHSEPLAMIDELRRLIERDPNTRLNKGADHLLYHLLDLGVDTFLPAFETLDDVIDSVQDDLLHGPTSACLQTITQVKHAALRMHRVLIPQREVLNRLARDTFALIDARDRVYFRDVYDHLVRLHDISETLRDLIAGSLDMYLSAISNRTNEVMKTLTIVTVLVLPLNFVVGFFGMNFFGDNIQIHDIHFSHTMIFVAICLFMLIAPYVMWVWARWRGWF